MNKEHEPVACPQLSHDTMHIDDLLSTMCTASAHMFDRALLFPAASSQHKFLLAKVLEAHLVKRQIWKVSWYRLEPCAIWISHMAENANSIGVVLQLLQQYSAARRWFQLACDGSLDGSIANVYAALNLETIDRLDESLSGSATPEQVHSATPSEDAGASDGLSSADALLVMTTDNVLARACAVLRCFEGAAAGAASADWRAQRSRL
jgi:hypothetical protein